MKYKYEKYNCIGPLASPMRSVASTESEYYGNAGHDGKLDRGYGQRGLGKEYSMDAQ